MDRHSSLRSTASSTGSTPPVVRHVRSGSEGLSSVKRSQNYAAKAAAQRLAQVMASQSNEDDEEDDFAARYSSSLATDANTNVNARSTKAPSPGDCNSISPPGLINVGLVSLLRDLNLKRLGGSDCSSATAIGF
eukprot:Gb_22979 [translate_table: standard]